MECSTWKWLDVEVAQFQTLLCMHDRSDSGMKPVGGE